MVNVENPAHRLYDTDNCEKTCFRGLSTFFLGAYIAAGIDIHSVGGRTKFLNTFFLAANRFPYFEFSLKRIFASLAFLERLLNRKLCCHCPSFIFLISETFNLIRILERRKCESY